MPTRRPAAHTTLTATDHDGRPWRVADQRFGPDAGLRPGQRAYHPSPDPRANYRAFCAKVDGVVRVRILHRRVTEASGFAWDDLSPGTLDAELRTSGWAPALPAHVGIDLAGARGAPITDVGEHTRRSGPFVPTPAERLAHFRGTREEAPAAEPTVAEPAYA